MKAFYSILSAVINPVSSEKISLGLLLSDGNSSLFDYSVSRLSIISSLVEKESKKYIRQYLRSIETVIKCIDTNDDQLTILDDNGKNLIINEQYIQHLSVYSTNLISFSTPAVIDVEVKPDVFTKLFSSFIDDDTIAEPVQRKAVQAFRSDFLPRVSEYFNTEKEITPKHYSQLLLPVSLDLMGINERPVIGQFVDLENRIDYIKGGFYDFQQMIGILENSKNFLISIEPSKEKFPQQHYFWNEIRKHPLYTYVDAAETESIREYAIDNHVKPFEF